ncbi:hypothetical protein [Streptomyces capoamus]|uniref:Uncharacterized protein n=1 Tax=Streptomyces capoamus TaxID=68183 RepID=A0A919EZG8_9ACTN|nr:hypothetical protein [Streptomyces capoamus]GGW15914.1 hypothetical protein GCM10010501_29890 [Streptomyces libani subsp. rufus]GHG61641.1 hypothetical protein GCM10018980_50920 [Streptomyces capoamus]
MAYASHRSPLRPPRPDLTLARDCEQCLGWGTVVTRDGDHELCHVCQPDPADTEGPAASGS